MYYPFSAPVPGWHWRKGFRKRYQRARRTLAHRVNPIRP